MKENIAVMKSTEQKIDKIQWFEWAMLFVALVIIAVSVYYVEGGSGAEMATGRHRQSQDTQMLRNVPSVPLDQRLLQPASTGRSWDNLGLERSTYSRPENLVPIAPSRPSPRTPQASDSSALVPQSQ
jgi:hypothetical protein